MTLQRRRLLSAWSAALAAPLVWAASTQSGQILPYTDCAHGQRWTAITALTAAALSLLGAGICWRSRVLSRTGRFACAVGSLLALLLAFAIALQAAAGFILTGCER
jgi:hypothetical protein